MPDPDVPPPPIPESRVVARRRTRVSPVWIIPIVAAVVGLWVAVTRILAEGPEITIVFRSAEGLEPRKTKIEYNGIDVGDVKTVRLSEDHRSVIVTAQMAPKTRGFLVDDTKFWIVRPRISGASISGLGTLISGAYIGMEIGKSRASQSEFVALENPPVVTGETPGRFFALKAADLGSLDNGMPVYFRRLQVGQVTSYQLGPDGSSLKVKLFVKAPYDQYVTANTRFWQASGIDVSLSANGFSLQTQSLLSVLVGGIAFETPAEGSVLPAAEADTEFTLFPSRAEALKLPARNPETYLLVFRQSVRGLAVGAPVEFKGIVLGEVADIRARFSAKAYEFSVAVTIRLDPARFGLKVVDLNPGVDPDASRHRSISTLVARGMRAQLQSGNLLTGGLYVAFDLFPKAAPASVDWTRSPVELPTTPGALEGIEASLASIVKNLNEVPFKGIGDDLRKTLADVDQTLASARGAVHSAGNLIESSSPLGQQLESSLQEVTRAARSLRALADSLERHPEALLAGKSGRPSKSGAPSRSGEAGKHEAAR